jgi:hypothetical protein
MIDQAPWASSASCEAVAARMFSLSTSQIAGGTNVETMSGFALKDLDEGHGQVPEKRNGRLVGTRTPDLHRVKVAL